MYVHILCIFINNVHYDFRNLAIMIDLRVTNNVSLVKFTFNR